MKTVGLIKPDLSNLNDKENIIETDIVFEKENSFGSKKNDSSDLKKAGFYEASPEKNVKC